MKVNDVMVEIETISPYISVEKVAKELDKADKNLLVMEDEKILGEVHEGLLVREMIPEEKLDEDSFMGALGVSYDDDYFSKNARQLMQKINTHIRPKQGLGEAAYIMHRNSLRSIPVKEHGEIKGVLHEEDMIKHLEQDENSE